MQGRNSERPAVPCITCWGCSGACSLGPVRTSANLPEHVSFRYSRAQSGTTTCPRAYSTWLLCQSVACIPVPYHRPAQVQRRVALSDLGTPSVLPPLIYTTADSRLRTWLSQAKLGDMNHDLSHYYGSLSSTGAPESA